ncbi:MAG: lasso peptide biosynthesis B2 protein [Candidatus Limnocylindria bacterium]|jgi:hypothetical protein
MLRRFVSLPRDDRRLFLAAMLSLLVTDAGLRVLGFQRLCELIAPPAARRAAGHPDDVVRSQRYRRWIDAAARHHPARTHCLQRSLVLHWWLRREGVPSELRVGVRKEDDRLQAHAWVELGAYVLNDPSAKISQFAVLEAAAARDPSNADRAAAAGGG